MRGHLFDLLRVIFTLQIIWYLSQIIFSIHFLTASFKKSSSFSHHFLLSLRVYWFLRINIIRFWRHHRSYVWCYFRWLSKEFVTIRRIILSSGDNLILFGLHLDLGIVEPFIWIILTSPDSWWNSRPILIDGDNFCGPTSYWHSFNRISHCILWSPNISVIINFFRLIIIIDFFLDGNLLCSPRGRIPRLCFLSLSSSFLLSLEFARTKHGINWLLF